MIMNLNPLVWYEDNFVTDYECDQIIELSRGSLERSQVQEASGERVEHEGRTSQNTWLDPKENDIVKNIYDRVAQKLCMNPIQCEPLQVVNYGSTQEYKPHFDTFTDIEEENANGGQRVMTALLYLNTPISGGGTVFPELYRRVDAKKGRMVVFSLCYPGSNEQHPYAKHGGEPVGMGEKWAANIWFRMGEFRPQQ